MKHPSYNPEDASNDIRWPHRHCYSNRKRVSIAREISARLLCVFAGGAVLLALWLLAQAI